MALSLPFSTLDDKAEAQAGASAGSTQTRITLHFDTDSHESRQHSACCTHASCVVVMYPWCLRRVRVHSGQRGAWLGGREESVVELIRPPFWCVFAAVSYSKLAIVYLSLS